MIGNFLGYFEKLHSYLKLHWLLFGQLLEKLGYFLLQHLVTLGTTDLLFNWFGVNQPVNLIMIVST